MKGIIRTVALLASCMTTALFFALPAVSTERVQPEHRVDNQRVGDRGMENPVSQVPLNTPAAISTMPDTLRPASGEELVLTLFAQGVQIYQCQATTNNQTGFGWVFRGPEADLFDQQNQQVGTHYAGPVWESNDGSMVLGEVTARADATEPNAIPWLLLSAKNTEGNGVFGEINSIQRLDTVGGVAPTGNCDETMVGTEARIRYTAIYNFYTPDRP